MNLIRPSKASDEATIFATVEIFGVYHHAMFVEVKKVDDMQEAVNDPYDRMADIDALNEGYKETVKVPGFSGDYLCCIYPFAE